MKAHGCLDFHEGETNVLQRTLLGVLLIFTANTSVHAAADRTPTVDQLTCRQAVDYVHKYKRYYKKTVDGAIPMYPITPVDQNQQVNLKEVLSFHVVQTRDQARCLIGYTARAAN